MNGVAELLDIGILWEYRQLVFAGLAVNLYVFVFAVCIAFALGVLIACGQNYGPSWLRRLLSVFAEFFRNVPDYILLIWIFVALPVFLSKILGYRVIFIPTATAIASLSLSYGVYFAETLRAGFQSTPDGQIQSAQALGMMPGTILFRILIPQILLKTSPELMNVCISLFKTTSIVSLIAVPDLMYQISNMSGQIMRPVPLYTGGALIYVAIIIGASMTVRWYTQRLHSSRM